MEQIRDEKSERRKDLTPKPSLSPSAPSDPSTNKEPQNHSQHPLTAEEPPQNDEVAYPTSIKMALTTLALLLAAFLAGLDRTIVATAVPRITSDFNSLDDIGWYGSAYLLTNCSFQLLYGKMYGVLSIKKTFLAAIVIFEIGSIVCATAPNSAALIIGRAIAGLGCAGINSGVMVIISLTVPMRTRPVYTAMIGGAVGIASVTSPLLAGAFTDSVTWRWCFYVNLPIGGFSLLVIAFLLSIPQDSKRVESTPLNYIKQFDLLGSFIFVPANVCLLLALEWAGNTYAWNSWRIIFLLCLCGLLFVIWGAVQFWKEDLATLPPRIMKQRSMAFASWYAFSLTASTMIVTYFLPLWFQSIKGASATRSGIDYLGVTVGASVFSILAGIFTTKIGHYVPMMILGSALLCIGSGLLTTLKIDTPSPRWIGYTVIIGASLVGYQQPMLAAQVVFNNSAADVSTGVSAIIFFQTLGGAILISVGQTVFSNRLLSTLRKRVPGLDPQVVVGNGAAGLRDAVAKVGERFVEGVLVAYDDAIARVFVVACVMAGISMVGALGMEWRSVKEKKPRVEKG
ncbi:putative MFS toxin efflux pump [Bisporella sp. PMI_857]|nr:putative MFS toxin efflux pump [Bisporella sp. PMI_857]